jgi:hypothetical protein
MSINNQLTIRFGGEGNIKVETLTNFLNEYKELFLLINKELGYTPDDFSIEVSPPENGSFKIKLKPKYKDLLFDKLGDLSVGVLLGILAFATAGISKSSDIDEIKKLLVEKEITETEAPQMVQNIIQNTGARQNIRQTFIIVNDDENITGLKIEKQDKEIINIPRKNFSKYIENSTEESENQEIIVESDIFTDDASLVIKTLHFEGQAKWGFVFRGYPIKASIKDTDFQEKLGSESFCKGDVLKVRLSRKRNYDKELQTFIVDQNSYVIEKVLDHISKRNTQSKIGY